MNEFKEYLAQCKKLNYLYHHRKENQDEYEKTLKIVGLTHPQMAKIVDSCKGEDRYWSELKAKTLAQSIFTNATEDEIKLLTILVVIICFVEYMEQKKDS